MPNTYSSIRRNVRLDLSHEVFFTRDAFEMDNSTLADLLKGDKPGKRTKAIVYLDEGILDGNPNLPKLISDYFAANQSSLDLVCAPGFVRGGEEAKNDWNLVEVIWSDLNKYGMCRHSYVIVVGGGAALDLVGFAASTAHRGVRLVRFPTTTLSQGDGGVGVKNGINFFGKKNWVGTFAVPEAVVNDFSFLRTLPDNQKRAGYVEAIKVALIRDRAFFEWIEGRAHELAKFMAQPMEQLIRRSAALHLDHIAGSGDPFERGSARPLDFGHWIAHKLEPMSGFEVGHGDAVAIGLAADVVYCARVGLLKEEAAERVLGLLESLGFEIYHPLLHAKNEQGGSIILNGLEEFREHLGGKLTITLIQALGQGVEVHQMDDEQVLFAIDNLRSRSLAHTQA
jgi:3-dehydroquinate synthase